MFVMSFKNFLVPRADGSMYKIQKDFIGEIPQDVAESWLVQAAIKSGWIVSPTGRSDAVLRASEAVAEEISAEGDKRPDAPKKRRRKAE